MKKLLLLLLVSLFCGKAYAAQAKAYVSQSHECHRVEEKIKLINNKLIKKEIEFCIGEALRNFNTGHWLIPERSTITDLCEKRLTGEHLYISFEYITQNSQIDGKWKWRIFWSIYGTSLEDVVKEYNDTLTNFSDAMDNTTGLSEIIQVAALRKIIYEYANQPCIELVD